MIKASFSANQTARTAAVAVLVVIALAAVAAVSFTPSFGKWTRLSSDPILSPKGDTFEPAGTFNPAVVKKAGILLVNPAPGGLRALWMHFGGP